MKLNMTLLILQLGKSPEEKEKIKDLIFLAIEQQTVQEKKNQTRNESWMVGYEAITKDVIETIRKLEL